MKKKTKELIRLIEELQFHVSNDEKFVHDHLSMARKIAVDLKRDAKASETKNKMLMAVLRL